CRNDTLTGRRRRVKFCGLQLARITGGVALSWEAADLVEDRHHKGRKRCPEQMMHHCGCNSWERLLALDLPPALLPMPRRPPTTQQSSDCLMRRRSTITGSTTTTITPLNAIRR